jgi:dipeptidyl aminopeptidase/acylaminoacyl peptidase
MCKKTSVLLLSLSLAIPVLAQMPPLVDRDLFFGEVEIAGAQISPDGKYISFLKPYRDTRNIWVKKAEEPFAAAKPITADKRPVPFYFWSRDSRFILYVQDQAGDENYNVFAVDPAGTPKDDTGVPEARNLTERKEVRAMLYAVPKTTPDIIYVGLNDRDKAWHDLYQLKLSTGESTLMRQNTDRVVRWIFDNQGKLRLAQRSADNGDTEILRVDADKFTLIYSCGVLEQCNPVRFDKDNARIYMITNKGAAVDLSQLVLLDPATGKTEFVESDPEKRVDLGGAIFSDRTNELIATRYEDDRERYLWKNKEFEADYKWLEQQLPGRDVGFGSSTADERLFMVSTRSDVEPGESYLFDRGAKKLTLQYKLREKLPREALSPMTAIRYRSSDGLEIPAYLTVPKGLEPKNLPLIVFPHGGPWGRDSWGYHTFAQFLSNRGYAVLQMNFRGSVGYGKKFLDAGNGEWGQKMQDDVTWGVKHLVSEGIADPKRVGIAGGSYGGYATLAGVAFTPDLYAAAVPIVAPSNLITLLDSIPPYWEAVRKMFHHRMGDPSTPEGRQRLERQSPLNSADKIRTPLLVVQGANDPRVKKHESDQIVVALRDRKFPVEYLVAPDEGHGFARPINNLAMVAAMEKFFAGHLGGRYQEEMPTDVAARLKEITVDPATVTLAAKVDTSKVDLPALAGTLPAGVSRMNSRIEMHGQTLSMEATREVKEEGDTLVIVERAKSPMGEGTDTAVLDKKTLALLRRTLQQGPLNLEVEFRDGKAKGKMAMGGQQREIDADTGGTLFVPQYGIAALPLAEGYTTLFREFDLRQMKQKIMKLAVTGTETVTVPAGQFDTFKVEVADTESGTEKTTYWVAKEPRKVVKVAAVLPQMGGAQMSGELIE